MREHSARVLAYAANRGASRAEAEDVVSEVFLVCWRRLDDVPSPPLPWILGVTRKVLANQRRSRARQRAVTERVGQSVAAWDTGWVSPSAAGDFVFYGKIRVAGRTAERQLFFVFKGNTG